MIKSLWRLALGDGHSPSPDQETAITAPAHGRRSLDAGAGTGKTSTLALRALYLIESGAVRADQIVVVTFTKKAAAEIGGRITDAMDRALTEGAHSAGNGSGTRCTTIHALAADILREFALTFNFASSPRPITDGEAYGVFHEAFKALLDGKLDVDASVFPIAEINIAQLERDLGKLALRLKNHGISVDDFTRRALGEAQRFGAQEWGQLWLPGKRAGSRISLFPKEPIALEDLTREAERERANIGVVAALFREFDRRLRARDRFTYGDLISDATSALRKHPEIVAALRKRWRYLLLDESQDTSAMQLAFIETVFGKIGDANACGMMPVGDKRQAIYGFNGADEEVMSRISAVADSTHPLTVNRRSPQEIVDAGHVVLESLGIVDASTPRLVAARGPATLSCIRLQRFGSEEQNTKERVAEEAAAIAGEVKSLLSNEGDPAKTSDIAILLRRRTHAYSYVRALNERGVPAALDRRSGLFATDEVRDLIAWMSLLVDLGDQQAAVRILQSPVCGLNDAAMITIAESSHWLDSILTNTLSGNVDADTRGRIDHFRAIIGKILPCAALPIPSAITELLREIPIAAAYARLGDAIGAQAIVNLRSFVTLANDFNTENPLTHLSDFVNDVRRRILYDDEPPEAELDCDGVRVMTIHQAKGLEWPYVFVACSTKNQYGTSGPSDAVVTYDLPSGAFALKNDVDGRETFHWSCKKYEHDAMTGEKVEFPVWKALAEREQARVFYVAVTRAQRRAYITAPCAEGTSGSATYLDAISQWANQSEPGIDLRFHRPGESANSDADTHLHFETTPLVGKAASAHPVQISLFKPRISFSAISTYQTCPRQARLRYRILLPDLRERPRYVGVGDGDGHAVNAARLGSIAHRILELWGEAMMDGQNLTSTEAYERCRLEFADATAVEFSEACERANFAIEALHGFTIEAVEAPFSTVVADTVLEGAIDLIARDGNGVLHVIDYKTGRADDQHYALQLALYVHAASERYPGEAIIGAILRLTASDASMTIAPSMSFAEIEMAVSDAGVLENDQPNVGAWCASCPYNGAPCSAA